MSMTYGDILDDVLGNPDRFETTLRDRAGRAVNLRYAHLWSLEDWSFKYDQCNPTVSANTRTLGGLPTNWGIPVYLWSDKGGEALPYLEIAQFNLRYLPVSYGTPEAWTVIDGDVILGPTPSAAATYTAYYSKLFTALSSETLDSPLIPAAFHLALVHGGRAELLAASDDPTAGTMEQQWQTDIEAMRREYLKDAVGQPDSWPSDEWAVSSGYY